MTSPGSSSSSSSSISDNTAILEIQLYEYGNGNEMK